MNGPSIRLRCMTFAMRILVKPLLARFGTPERAQRDFARLAPLLFRPPKGAALGRSDLILAPAIGPFEAKNVVKGINEYLVEPDNVLGMIPGCRAGDKEIPATREAFDDIPVLNTTLPWSEAIGDQTVHGDIGKFVASLKCEQFGTGYGRFRDAQSAWSAVLALTVEVQWALNGLRLQPHVSEWELSTTTKQQVSA